MNERYRAHQYEGETPSRHQHRAWKEKVSTAETTPAQLMVRRYLESLNEEMLQTIISEYIGAAGRNIHHHSGFVPFEDVKIIDDKKDPSFGQFIPGYHYTQINSAWLADDPVQTLYTLIHEELHACSNHITTTKESDVTRFEINNGVSTDYMSVARDTGTIIDKSINEETQANEGITELLTHECLREYLKRTGDAAMYGEAQIESVLYKTRHEHIYGPFQKALDFYAIIISSITQVGIEVVRKGFYRSYFRNGEIISPDIAEVLEEYIPNSIQKIQLLFADQFTMDDFEMLKSEIENSPKFEPSEKTTLITALIELINEQPIQKEALIDRGILPQ